MFRCLLGSVLLDANEQLEVSPQELFDCKLVYPRKTFLV